jgi:hypothetical protein
LQWLDPEDSIILDSSELKEAVQSLGQEFELASPER